MKLSIFGSGYVGLVTGVCFAEHGHNVICADIDAQKIDFLKSGSSPIYEPGLEPLLEKNTKAGRLEFTTDIKRAIQESDILFIAVGTPSDEDGSADLKYVMEVSRQIAKDMNAPKVIVTKSTVPVGTQNKIKACIKENLSNKLLSFDVCSNPEFLREGSAIQDCLKPSRVVIGVDSENAKRALKALYSTFVENESQVIIMDPASSELTKYAANTMLAARISFMNELSQICESVGADIEHIKKGIGTDHRIGAHFLNAGIGYGGSCFPKDVRALSKTGKELKLELKMLSAIADANQNQKQRFFEKIKTYFKNNLEGKNIALWGLSFKPGTDDLREAPSLDLISQLTLEGAKVKVYDPISNQKFSQIMKKTFTPEQVKNISLGEDRYDVLSQSDCLCIITEWPEFKNADLTKLKKLLKNPVIFDGRNIFTLSQMSQIGIKYISIGRPTNHAVSSYGDK